ncbi:SERine Proteinase [Proteiniphilum saccharofermentans]|uniref:SERine Proteinase n=1 Tax=Proteiniphilum saccharofermentans TaxID=1642647 RepID=A0A1R3T533_9BACT|nr:serpin family protein [Proteiniphilum saccharofermentans]SCD21169.1 SERine Proteinase [Proteiniphilum saccharofermentans]
MLSKINSLLLMVIITSLFWAMSCDKNGSDVRAGDLPDPIRIDLRSAERQMVRADQTFAFEFFEHLFVEESLGEDNNFMVSPLSLSMALAMTWNGAAGKTKEAMQQTLKMDGFSDDELNSYYKKLREALLKTDPSTKLSIANAIFTNQSVKIKPDFVNTNRSFYEATVEAVDFTRPETVSIINKWASDNTNGLIEKVIENTKPEDLMYLLNAIYFKGIWTSEFDKKNTSERPFTYENGTRKNVEMMKQTAKFNYTNDGNLQLVQLPYGNQAFSMMVLLPAEDKKLQDVIATTRQEGYWENLKSGLHEAEVELSLPKFKTEYSKRLNEVLAKMGMGIAFANVADFSRMSDAPAKIDFVKQDTYISTDELGTEAAVVTTIGMIMTSLPVNPEKVVFNANRPFLYLIQENSTGAILFMGAVKNFDK